MPALADDEAGADDEEPVVGAGFVVEAAEPGVPGDRKACGAPVPPGSDVAGVSPFPPFPPWPDGPPRAEDGLVGPTDAPCPGPPGAPGRWRAVMRSDDHHRRDGPGRYDRRGRARPGIRMMDDAVPRPGPGRADGLREAIGTERPCAIRHGQPVRHPGRRAIGQHLQQLFAEPGEQRDYRRRTHEQRGRQFPALALPADLAPFDVPADPLAHQHGHLPIPARQHGVQVRAGLTPRARDDQRAEGSFQLAASPRQLRVGVLA